MEMRQAHRNRPLVTQIATKAQSLHSDNRDELLNYRVQFRPRFERRAIIDQKDSCCVACGPKLRF
jgi:hypothetical protein